MVIGHSNTIPGTRYIAMWACKKHSFSFHETVMERGSSPSSSYIAKQLGMGRIVDLDKTGYRTIRKTGFRLFFRILGH